MRAGLVDLLQRSHGGLLILAYDRSLNQPPRKGRLFSECKDAESENIRELELDGDGVLDALEGLEFATDALSDDNPITLDAKNALGYLRQRQQRWEESEALYREVLATQLETLGREHTETAVTLQSLACLYRDSGRYVESRELFEEVIAIQEKSWGANHAWSVDNLEDYLKLLKVMGDEQGAPALEARVRAIKKKEGRG